MRLLFLIVLFSTNYLCAQISDDFSDGDFTSNPEWTGDTSHFNVNLETLYLNAPASTDTSALACLSAISTEASWSIKINLDFNPSSSNYVRVYLMSDQSDLTSPLRGYFVKIGGSKDDVSLYRQDGKSTSMIIDGKDKRVGLSSATINLKVLRDESYKWTLMVDSSGVSNFKTEGEIQDSTYKSSKFFGIFCRYTSSRSTKFSFDDVLIDGKIYKDKVRPTIISQEIISGRNWRILFSEKLNASLLNASFFNIIDKTLSIEQIQYDSTINSLTIVVNEDLPHGEIIKMSIDSIFDLSDNKIKPIEITSIYNYPDSLRFKEVIFNEIMPDPDPPLGLPTSEYIELYNRRNKYIKIEGWLLADRKDTVEIPAFTMAPMSYLVLAEENDTVSWGNLNGNKLFIDLVSLNNDKDFLYLMTDTKKVIDSLRYFKAQFKNSKNDGGQSLELVATDNICYDTSNWKLSINIRGGSPGQINSILNNDDPLLLDFSKVISVNDTMIRFKIAGFPNPISFSKEKFSSLPLLDLKNLWIEEKTLIIIPDDDLIKNKKYQFSINDVTDCFEFAYNSISSVFINPGKIENNDLIINEVLFNPYPGGSDFVEIYNRSSKYFDLSKLYLSNRTNDTIANIKQIKLNYELLSPGEYFAFSEDTNHLTLRYTNSSLNGLRTMDLPSYSDKSGSVILLDGNFSIIDEFPYNESMHFSLLSNTEGVSLERIMTDGSSGDSKNWTSASSSSGFATPGKFNSQLVNGKSKSFSLQPDIFSPDNDGYNDVLLINYKFGEASNAGSVKIFNANGSLVRDVVKNETFQTEGTIIWDGQDNFNNKVPVGYYLVLFEIINNNGTSRKEISTVVVANKFK